MFFLKKFVSEKAGLALHISKKLVSEERLYIFIVTFSLTLYSIFCTAYSDIIVQNQYEWMRLPWEQVLGKVEKCVNAKDLFGPQMGGDGNVYLFLIDTSQSVSEHTMKKPIWYKPVMEWLGNKSMEIGEVKKDVELSYLYLAKIRASSLLVKLLENKNVDDKFAIWTMGSEGKKIFPGDNEGDASLITESNIRKAIEVIKDYSIDDTEATLNTDFKNVFNKIKGTYGEKYLRKQRNKFDDPDLVLTILSDLRHDVKQKYGNEEEKLEEDEQELKKLIKSLSSYTIVVNMLILDNVKDGFGFDLETEIRKVIQEEIRKGLDEESNNRLKKKADGKKKRKDGYLNIKETIYPYFEHQIDWFRLNKIPIERYTVPRHDFLYPISPVQNNSVKFYYEDPTRIQNSFRIKFDETTNMKVSIPSETKFVGMPDVDFTFAVLGENGTPRYGEDGETPRYEYIGRLVSDGRKFDVSVLKNQHLELTYSGRLPPNLASPLLRISIEEYGRAFLVPVDFIKILPALPAWIMIIIQVCFYLTCPWMIILGVKIVRKESRVYAKKKINDEDEGGEDPK